MKIIFSVLAMILESAMCRRDSRAPSAFLFTKSLFIFLVVAQSNIPVDARAVPPLVPSPFVKPLITTDSIPAQGGTNISKTTFDDKASKKEQLPKHSSTPSTPPQDAGKDDAIDDRVKTEKGFFKLSFGDSTFEITNRLRIESLYGQNLRFLNNENNEEDPQLDKIAYPGRHTLDIWFLYTYGQLSKGYDVAKCRLGLRNRAVWGNEVNNLLTTSTFVRNGDVFIGAHTHAISRHIFWARELWFEVVLNDVLRVNTPLKHTFTMGLFPFSLGRGIALGDAFATDPDFLGYFGANAIDQFAPGFKLSGELLPQKVLGYDLYAEVVDNSSSTFDEIVDEVNSQRFGRRFTPQRGFGVFDYILAGRLMWRPVNDPGNRVYLEPYGLYSFDGEQKIEFIGDAKQRLFTFGLAGEFEYGNFEWGFDTAFNIGKQTVFGWDRNIAETKNKDGFQTSAYTEIFTEKPEPGKKVPQALVTEESKKAAAASKQGQQFNGQRIHVEGDTDDASKSESKKVFFNGLNRFTNQYENHLRGAMFVFDFAYKFPRTIKVAGTAGIATGGEDPNKDLASIGESNREKDFRGFVGEQEIYSGKRVRSLFVMAGEGKIPRVFSIPAFDTIDGEPRRTSRFTNLILAGTGVQIKPSIGSVICDMRSNILAFWVDKRPRVFEARKHPDESFEHRAHVKRVLDSFLGVEINFILEAEIIKDLTFIFNSAVFIPGGFFRDLKGVPLKRDHREFLQVQKVPTQALRVKKIPLIGNDLGFFVNFAFEYRF